MGYLQDGKRETKTILRQPGPGKVYTHFGVCQGMGYRNTNTVIIYEGNSQTGTGQFADGTQLFWIVKTRQSCKAFQMN